VPRVAGVAPVHPAWRFAPKPLVKNTPTSNYAPHGAETSIWIRPATTHDTKAFAKPTHGAWGWAGQPRVPSAPPCCSPLPAPRSHPTQTPYPRPQVVRHV
jgi:hypothetical protein